MTMTIMVITMSMIIIELSSVFCRNLVLLIERGRIWCSN